MSDLFCFKGIIDNIIYHGGGGAQENPYGKVGDVVCVCVLSHDNNPELVVLVLESYGTMTPSNSNNEYYNSPFDWCYSSDSISWKMAQNNFQIQCDGFEPPFTIMCSMNLIVNPIK